MDIEATVFFSSLIQACPEPEESPSIVVALLRRSGPSSPAGSRRSPGQAPVSELSGNVMHD